MTHGVIYFKRLVLVSCKMLVVCDQIVVFSLSLFIHLFIYLESDGQAACEILKKKEIYKSYIQQNRNITTEWKSESISNE